jgi:hypothetical protein
MVKSMVNILAKIPYFFPTPKNGKPYFFPVFRGIFSMKIARELFV